jgi:Fe-S-cluster containining protein
MMQQSISRGEPSPVLNPDSSFDFKCHADLPCFTQCCRDVNIYLTPYDVLRLRRSLKIGSEAFLNQYTRHFLAKTTHIPVVQFALEPRTLRCRFVGDEGCTVYQDRPWACRLYPLDLAEGDPDRYQVMVSRDRCLGLAEPGRQTVGEWLEGQGIAPFAAMDRAYHGIMPAGFKRGQWLDPGVGKLLFLAYDLDRFARLLDDPRLRKFYEIDDALLERVAHDDEVLLLLAFRYIRSQLEDLLGEAP